MKKWIIFATLKFLELVGLSVFIFAEYLLGDFMFSHFRGENNQAWFIDIGIGLYITIVIAVIIFLVWGFIYKIVPYIIRINIEWAERISNETKEKP